MRRSHVPLSLFAVATLASWLALVPEFTDARAPAPKHVSYTETIPGTKVTFEMIAVPGGVFVMGSALNEKNRNTDEGPAHRVEIRPFWMGKCEVTWDEWDIYYKETMLTDATQLDRIRQKDPDAITGPTPAYIDQRHGHGHHGHPALGMTHHAAMEYCRWLSKQTGKTYRLPTEAEWEYAARAGTDTAYHFGDDPKKLGDYAWFADNSQDTTHPVGTKKANPWGLHDMYGNVMEWCVDHYDKDQYRKFSLDKPTLSPVNMPTDRRFPHVARGGSWADSAADCRSAVRRSSDKSWMRLDAQKPQSIWWLPEGDFIGFRIVRAVEEQDELKGLRSKVTRESK
jgi:formylglycine-generating enzyme required for sulfatase activity